MHSLKGKLNEIFVSNIFNGNVLAPLDIPPDTKNTTRGRVGANSNFESNTNTNSICFLKMKQIRIQTLFGFQKII